MRSFCTRYVVLSLLVSTVCWSCGSVTSLKKGDTLEVVHEFSITANIEGDIDIADGFKTILPEGTILKVTKDVGHTATHFECQPVTVNGNSDPNYIVTSLVPDGIRNQAGFEGYNFTLPLKIVGDKLKKL